MNRKQNLEVFAKTPVRKAVLLQIVPAVASQMVTLVYNLADTYFVGMLNAPHETAAVTVAYPSFLMLTAISNLFGVGGGNLDLSMDMIRGLVVGTKYASARNPRYETIKDMPAWAQEETQRLVDRGALRGDEHGNLNVTMDMLRTMIVCQRMVDENK